MLIRSYNNSVRHRGKNGGDMEDEEREMRHRVRDEGRGIKEGWRMGQRGRIDRAI
jgi:hypothetical protein